MYNNVRMGIGSDVCGKVVKEFKKMKEERQNLSSHLDLKVKNDRVRQKNK